MATEAIPVSRHHVDTETFRCTGCGASMCQICGACEAECNHKQPREMPPPAQPQPAPNLVIEESVVPYRGTVLSTLDQPPVAEKLLFYEELGLNLSTSIEEATKAIADQQTYDQAAEQLRSGRKFIAETDEFLEPIRGITYAMYTRVLAIKKNIQGEKNGDGVLGRLPLLSNAIVAYEKKKEEEAKAAQRLAAQQQQEAEREQNLEAAVAAEEAGMDARSVQTILERPSSAPTPAMQPTFQRVKGVSRRENWCAEEDESQGGFWALVKAAAKNKALLPLLYRYDPEEKTSPNLNAQARSLKQSMNETRCIRGFRAVDKGAMAVRG